MRYLTLVADYTQSGLSEDDRGPITPEELGVPLDLANKIREWNDRYRQIIPLDMSDREAAKDRITLLDEEGVRLASEVGATVQEVKVRYYSEGLLRYL